MLLCFLQVAYFVNDLMYARKLEIVVDDQSVMRGGGKKKLSSSNLLIRNLTSRQQPNNLTKPNKQTSRKKTIQNATRRLKNLKPI